MKFGFGRASDRLGAWSFYFIAKLLLFWRGLIGLHPVENLVLVAVLVAPLKSPRARMVRHWLAGIAAVALLYYDSWLPPISRVLSQAGLVSGFSGTYLMELAGRFVSWPVVGMLAVALALFLALARFVRIDLLVVVALLAMLFVKSPDKPPGAAPAPVAAAGSGAQPAKTPDALLAEFFRTEASRSVRFAGPPEASPAFDVVFLHVCSLSWDDLQAAGLDQHALFKGFDLVLRRFNTAATYSGPAVIRILRAPCGQPTHRELYAPAREGCLLMPELAKAGFETNLALNHDGHFDDFLGFVKAQGVPVAPLPIDGLAAPQRSFDQSKIYDDRAVLARWMETRKKSAAPRVATFYNSVSLHDGNRLVADPSKASLDTYKVRLAKLLDDLDAFLKGLESSGRRTVVVFVPEHGAALRGDPMQIAGLREYPSPAITLVPVGIKVIGPDARRTGEPLHVNEPTSYLGLAHIVSRILAKPPYGAGGFQPSDYTANLPATDFVAENEGALVMRHEGRYLLRHEKEAWREYPQSAGQ